MAGPIAAGLLRTVIRREDRRIADAGKHVTINVTPGLARLRRLVSRASAIFHRRRQNIASGGIERFLTSASTTSQSRWPRPDLHLVRENVDVPEAVAESYDAPLVASDRLIWPTAYTLQHLLSVVDR